MVCAVHESMLTRRQENKITITNDEQSWVMKKKLQYINRKNTHTVPLACPWKAFPFHFAGL